MIEGDGFKTHHRTYSPRLPGVVAVMDSVFVEVILGTPCYHATIEYVKPPAKQATP